MTDVSPAPNSDPDRPPILAVVGDVHGHLQLALCMLARWQRHLGVDFDAVLLCGDVGTFADEGQLDSATRKHARNNVCELEFLRQWAPFPPAPWLEHLFRPADESGGGLGLTCPVVMVHGNHEGFAHLESLGSRRQRPAEPVPAAELRAVDSSGFIHYLPSGWRCRTPGGVVVGGVGGMEAGQRRAHYHPLAYIDEAAVEALLDAEPVDVLITHQGPAAVQGDHGSPTLDVLLKRPVARAWFHGHSTPVTEPTPAGTGGKCLVVPLGDVAFPGRGRNADDPGLDGWAYLTMGEGGPAVTKETPPFWRELRRSRWVTADDGRLVSPDLARFLWA